MLLYLNMAHSENGPGVVELPLETSEEYKAASNEVGRVSREIVAANKRYDELSTQFQRLMSRGVKTEAQKAEYDRLENEIGRLRKTISGLHHQYDAASKRLQRVLGR